MNPSHIEASVNLDIGFSSGFILKTYVGNSISGQNYSNGLTFGVLLNILFDTFSNNTRPHELPVKEVVTSKKESEDSYQIQTQDGVDQELFQKEREVVPVTPSKKEVRSNAPSNDDIQNQLDQAEMSIKIKSKKKKKKR